MLRIGLLKLASLGGFGIITDWIQQVEERKIND